MFSHALPDYYNFSNKVPRYTHTHTHTLTHPRKVKAHRTEVYKAWLSLRSIRRVPLWTKKEKNSSELETNFDILTERISRMDYMFVPVKMTKQSCPQVFCDRKRDGAEK